MINSLFDSIQLLVIHLIKPPLSNIVHFYIGFICLCCFSTYAQPSANNKGYIIYSLGVDTTFIGYYQLQDNNFQFKVLGRPGLSVTQIKGSVFPNGEIKESSGYSIKPTDNGEEQKLVDYTLYTDHENTYIKQVRNGKETVQTYKGKAMILNALGTPFLFFLPMLVKYAPEKVGQTVESNHFVLGQNRKFTIKRTAPDVLEMGSNIMGYFKLYLHPDGKLKFIDGIGSSWNVTGHVYDELDFDSYVKLFVASEKNAPLPPLNKKDSVLLSLNGTNIRIDYSRPSKRGRDIFGAVVPWNRVWRTGANEPTKLTISKSVYFGSKELPAGIYSLFTLPQPDGWMLIINKQTNMWGTDYDAAFDVMHIPMKTSILKEPVEMLSIKLVDQGKKGRLSISWDRTTAFVPFSTVAEKN
jgi:hypothetical protein